MLISMRMRRLVAMVIAVSMVFPVWASGAEPAPNGLEQARVHDIRLDARQGFSGAVMDGEGRPLSGREVVLLRTQRSERVARVESDEQGRFQFTNLAAGTYHVATSQGISVCRLWTEDAAPPVASKSLLIIDDPQVERGQHPIRKLYSSDPILMATVVAAAIAIPIAVHKSRDDAPPGS